MELAILFWCYKKVETCTDRLRLLRHHNPDTPIYVLFGGAPAEAQGFETEFAPYIDDFYAFNEGKPPYWKWRHGDVLISRWFSERGHQLKWESIVIVQWDMLMFAPVEQLFLHLQKNEVLISGALPMKERELGLLYWLGVEDNPQVERWWRDADGAQDPPNEPCRELATFLHDYHLEKRDLWWCVFIVVVFPRAFLERFADRSEPEIGFLEYTIPTLARSWGFDLCTRHPYNPWHVDNTHMYDMMLNAAREECPDRYVLLHLLDPWGLRIFHPYSRDVHADRLLHTLPAWLNFLRCKEWDYTDLFGDSTRDMARHAIAGYDLALPGPVTTRPTICLSMIVRNAAHIIEETLNSVAPHVSSWLIVDTGSDDGTQDLIESHMAHLGIPGELCQRTWRNFGDNQMEALILARDHGDYTWVIDSDDAVVGTPDFTCLGDDIYWMRYVDDDGETFWRARLFRDGVRVHYEGPVDEYAARDDELCRVGMRLEGDYHIKSHRLGARNLDPEKKFARDRDLLLAEVERNPQDSRSVVYLAESYFYLGDFVNARKWYALRAEMVLVADVNESDIKDLKKVADRGAVARWDQVVYYSMLRVAESMAELGEPWPDVQDAYLRAWEFRPIRAEALHAIAFQYRLKENYQLGYLFAQEAAKIPLPDGDTEFVRVDIHRWGAIDEQAICASWIGKHAEAFSLCRRLVASSGLPDGERQRISRNRDFSVPVMLEAASSYPEALVGSLVADPREGEVTVSLVAGPDHAATEQTLNSFLHSCTDIARVGRFLVLDAGLSAQHRAILQQRYGFLEFTEPEPDTGAQHAHLREQIHGRFWLHLAQGWRFFAPENLITRLTAVLDAEPNVFQVGINFADAAKLTGACATEETVHRAPDAGRYVLSDVMAGGPAMFDTARLNQADNADSADPDPITELARRAATAGLQTASLDEVLCITAI